MKIFKNISYYAVLVCLNTGFTLVSMDEKKMVVNGTIELRSSYSNNPDYDLLSSKKMDVPLHTLHSKILTQDTRFLPINHGVRFCSLPTRELFGCKDGSLVTYNEDGDPNNERSGMFRCIPNEWLKHAGMGDSFQDQFNNSVKNFIENPNKHPLYFGPIKNEFDHLYPLVQSGHLLPNGSHGPNGYPTEAHFRQKMIAERSNGAIGNHNLALSVLKRQQGASNFSRKEALQRQKEQEEEQQKQQQKERAALKFMMDNPSHNVNKPAKGGSHGGCIIL